MDKDKILIVEDNVDTVDLLRKRLHADGFDTAEAYDGEEGLKKVAEYEPDLIVLDIMMPKLDGFEVCKRLKEDESTRYIPVLMLTAKGDVDSTVKGLDVGGDDYLAKPFDYKELVARIRSLLSIKAEREKLLEEEKSEALEKMMDQVVHEIRNPLVAIGGFARRISESLSEGDPNREYLKLIVQNVETLEHMIKKLIELKTTVISYREPADINKIIAEAIEKYRPAIVENHIDVKTDLMKNPPDIFVDREQIKAAVSHLIENAIEAMRNKQRILEISSRVSEGYIEIMVSDTGVGIPKDKLKNILDPFFTSKIHAGLGLTYALKIIQAHRGTISVESKLGKGSVFTIRLPVKRPGSH
ncbi:MAG: response regulator [Deltaproteobacteria bacterium]|nr:response regulator [Deltaproteobacteria bacterium]MBW2097395.1 response regulator [Deltaproteobacteria bacterium]